ncbi:MULTISPECIES: EAL domain-containing protein [unclassified Clostridioides]|uniref:EAL domain-containing protein n=1 Tax=unclassified Clostridioides TaxID=2635829 RepID=UPI001D10A513|nr:EAL domain-containing protein [Clostridioides sp. ZZV14-6150]MCC0661308.1 EAL domain-containing protein [Clostridioides sp. ZZV14-6154]MCC0669129.1 EAL domain-containing protein [Clostridioides sp. ZZV14-6153]MCC0723056.1 EAL domain-containing protein [Clostridioides sp. ZZV14-6104]MCC0728483.1 EAL domain-containing protein [Clostridioides sp. ZZV14-6045]MCC0731055.1 EAL domain-containing protein [Clostridioides sp. ZZV14-6048]MCC0735413.1 EAL domain-containing protein [Clostridioides sp. 
MSKDTDFTNIEYDFLMNALDVSVSRHLIDEHYTVVWANNRYYEMFGYTKEEYESLFHNQCDLFYKENPDDWNELVNNVAKAFSKGERKYEHLGRMRHRNGKKLWIKLMGFLTGEVVDGFPVSYSVMVDITRQMLTQIEQTVTYNNFPGLIAKFKVTDFGFQLLDANKKYFDMFKNKVNFLIEDINSEIYLDSIYKYYDDFRNGKYICFPISPQNLKGEIVHMQVIAECIDWEDDKPIYLLIYSDVTKLVEQNKIIEENNKELEKLAFTDQTTGGMNRTQFNIIANEIISLSPAGTYTLVWLNMQKFKLINDLAGNIAGDKLLKYIYNCIKLHLNEGEFVTRIFADNFTLLLKEDKKNINSRLNAIVTHINRFNDNKDYKYMLYFTAGAYIINDTSLEITKIQDRANVASKSIKNIENHELCIFNFYSKSDKEKLILEKNIENRMYEALEKKEFQVYLQPKLELSTQVICGAEALVRWVHPVEGIMPPNEFIPLFEKNGFIVQLDLYVFEEVCSTLRKWIDSGLNAVKISVNMSRYHFSFKDFINAYKEIAEKYSIPPHLIEIEITETIVFKDVKVFSEIINEIHKNGFKCSIDDFGSGYSSINMLKDIYVDTIKLDRAFFKSERLDSQRERDIIVSIIDLSKKLNMTTVAEGIETNFQKNFLREINCDMLQGYVFSKPLPIKDFEKLMFQKYTN